VLNFVARIFLYPVGHNVIHIPLILLIGFMLIINVDSTAEFTKRCKVK